MSAFNTKLFRTISLLFIILTLAAFNARAALPDAGTEIGTRAIVQYEIDGAEEQSESNVVLTTIAQVYETKIEAVGGTVAKAGEEVDVRFSVRNIGNGADNLTLSLANDAGIPSFKLMQADDMGNATESTQVETRMDAAFKSDNIARDQVRHFVARVVAPANAKEEMKFTIKATNAKGDVKNETVAVKIVDGKSFTVEPVANVNLDDNKKAYVEFKVKGGAEAGSGYFELIVAKKSAPNTPVEFAIQKNQISFNEKDVASTAIENKDKAVTFSVADIAKNDHVDFKMGIEIDGARRGDDYVMYVKYGKSDAALTTSAAMQIGFAHTMMAPELTVKSNSAKNKTPATIPSAVSGDTVEYVFTLANKSSRAESFSLELGHNAAEIREISLVDAQGHAFVAASGSGLPETGLIPVAKSIDIKVKVALKHGMTVEAGKQEMMLTVKSITEPKTAAVVQKFDIEKIVPVKLPFVGFSNLAQNAIEELTVAGKDDVATFYLNVATPAQSGTALREYQIRFDSQDTTFQTVVGGVAVGPEVSAMAVKVNNSDKAGLFLVKTKMRGLAKLSATVTVTDVQTSLVQEATIQLKKDVSIGFAETGYNGKGAVDLDTVVVVDINNTGRAVTKGEYVIYAPANGDWTYSFSLDGKNWEAEMALPAMAAPARQAVQVKIRVPKNAKAGSIATLKLALREETSKEDAATSNVTLTIGKSKLKIVKTVAVEDGGSKTFAEQSNKEVGPGDVIWYRVVVTNPIDAPVAKNVRITDPLPKHVTFKASAAGEGQAKNEGGNVTMIIPTIEPGVSKTMEYSVTVDLLK